MESEDGGAEEGSSQITQAPESQGQHDSQSEGDSQTGQGDDSGCQDETTQEVSEVTEEGSGTFGDVQGHMHRQMLDGPPSDIGVTSAVADMTEGKEWIDFLHSVNVCSQFFKLS